MDCSPSGSSVHGIFQARILEWSASYTPGDLPDPGIKSASPAVTGRFSTTESPEKPGEEYLKVKCLSHPVISKVTSVTWLLLVRIQHLQLLPSLSMTVVFRTESLSLANSQMERWELSSTSWWGPGVPAYITWDFPTMHICLFPPFIYLFNHWYHYELLYIYFITLVMIQ